MCLPSYGGCGCCCYHHCGHYHYHSHWIYHQPVMVCTNVSAFTHTVNVAPPVQVKVTVEQQKPKLSKKRSARW